MKKDRFFSKFDWAAFVLATLVTFGVYFFTLGPSVGLEDSGELATAGAHLGVPHAPGYPFWTFCSWIFCKVFSGVTYMGHPTPAWAISLFSAVAGALAAGCTAMLICRSAQDILNVNTCGDAPSGTGERSSPVQWICFAGGVGGALTFAFSPVEWSQSTIVEIYSLNSLFLMLVLLLSYKWMRKPSDRTLWMTAFVFGLGLTNYQVLLFAIVPLALVILLRNITLFRDFAIYLIPVLLTYQVLQIGDLSRADPRMTNDVIEKHAPVGYTDEEFSDQIAFDAYRGEFAYALDNRNAWKAERAKLIDAQQEYRRLRMVAGPEKRAEIAAAIDGIEKSLQFISSIDDQLSRYPEIESSSDIPETKARTDSNPSRALVILSIAAFVGALLAGLFLKSRNRPDDALKTVLAGGGAGAAGLILSATLFSSSETWSGLTFATAPLAHPCIYIAVGAFTMLAIAAAVASSMCKGGSIFEGDAKKLLIASAALAALAVCVAFLVPEAKSVTVLGKAYSGPAFPWAKSTFVFWILIAVLFALCSCVKKGMAFAIPVAGFHIAAFVLLSRGAMNGLTHPASWWFWWPAAWNFAVLALAWHVLPHGRSVAGAAFFTQLGVAFYAYMPIVSDLRNPPMNWAYPRTWEGFKHAIGRKQYEEIKAVDFGGSLSGFFTFLKTQMGYYFADVKLQFTDFLALLAALPFACWKFSVKTENGRRTFRAIWVAAGILGIFLLRDFFGAGEAEAGSFWSWFDRVLLAVLAVLALTGVFAASFRQFIFRPALALRRFFKFRVPASANSLSLEARDVSQQWLLASGACFLVMSVLLIMLAKVQGDIQDNFIQKVKFIMSHAMIALWIGYGLVLLAVLVARFVPARWRRWAVAALVPFIMIAAAWQPLAQNWTNKRLVLEYGGSEQNGHTFGWQFGAYQLEGAKAIRDQIEEDEEPLPDPEWPPAMEDHAIFFGGTDPGRFVPTYMIYAANYRPDVYLITQNALADETYMQVERDLYGDEIWIPASEDNAQAFSDFVGRLTEQEKKEFGVSEENGRVQVTGALSVMKINERLTEMMFEKNSPRHAFYVEESYPIPWMYDFLVPHGLIMKISPAKTVPGQWPDLARRDREFWDWYTRRLLDDPNYRRDFAAQKSFAKLRTAISGVEQDRLGSFRTDAAVYKNLLVCAEQGLREGCLLAPISPESTLRYVQLKMMFSQMQTPEGDAAANVCKELLDYLDLVDPRNARTRRIRQSLDEILESKDRRRVLRERYDEAEAKLEALASANRSAMSGIKKRCAAGARPSPADVESAWRGIKEMESAMMAYGDVLSEKRCYQLYALMADSLAATFPECVRTAGEASYAAKMFSLARLDKSALDAIAQYGVKTGDPKILNLPFDLGLVLVRSYHRLKNEAGMLQTAVWLHRAHAAEWAAAVKADKELAEIEKARNAAGK
ncbi:MAG: DUF2723 domain-containing protein [Kiritimatiellae bacterium]|nr:DUF2723 domain-containing protein [Kiritimatiellia bacterium]